VAVYRRSRRHRFLLVLLVLTSITAITLDYRDEGAGALESLRQGARDVVAPLQSAAADVLEPVGDFFGGLTRYNSLQNENARLRQELDRARGQALAAEGAERERQALLELQRLDFPSTIPTVTARVIAQAPSNFQNTVVIDRGSEHNVVVGQPVVTGAGLVGRILEVSRTLATVQLVTDRSSNVGIRLTGSGEIGIASGTGSGDPLDIGFVAATAKVTEGEAVVTSGLQGSVFPPEIPVGTVRSARTPPGGVEQEITMDTAVDLRRLEFVRVMLWSPPAP
jgi:rod shape-determining protein MreC